VAKTKLTAGAELDFLTSGELRDVLKSWQTELTRGARLRRRAFKGTVTAAGELVMGDVDDGPAEGMAWAVTRFSVAPGPTVPAGGIQVYANDVNPSSLLISKLTTDLFPGDHGCNLLSGDSLRIAASGATAGDVFTVTVSVKEVPIQQVWSL
jgi:hypothetical protein